MIKNVRFYFSSLKFSKVKILHSSINQIHYNLAVEEYYYQHAYSECPLLFLWRNDRNVVIGRHQNPWKECFLQEMEKENVLLARRRSGGGAVYQDLGNSCFTFITPVAQNDLPLNEKEVNFGIILKALENLGIKANISGRNDIVVGETKISGSAFQVALGGKDGIGRKALHHGTMLINLDKEAATKFLNVNKEKLKSKGVDSVRSRIRNLAEINPSIVHSNFAESLRTQFLSFYSGLSVEESHIGFEHLNETPKLNEIYKELTSQNWLFSNTPEFTNNLEKRFEFGLFDFFFDVDKGIIRKGKVYSDSLFPDLVDYMNELINSGIYTYDFTGIRNFSFDVKKKFSEQISQLEEIEKWLIETI